MFKNQEDFYRKAILDYSVVDGQRVLDLIEFDQKGQLFNNIFNIFNDEIMLALPVLHLALEKNNYKEISRLSHRLFSTCYNSGAPRMGEIFRILEKLTQTEIPSNDNKIILIALLGLMGEEFKKATAQLKFFLH